MKPHRNPRVDARLAHEPHAPKRLDSGFRQVVRAPLELADTQLAPAFEVFETTAEMPTAANVVNGANVEARTSSVSEPPPLVLDAPLEAVAEEPPVRRLVIVGLVSFFGTLALVGIGAWIVLGALR